MNRIGVGIVGFGNVVVNVHFPILCANDEIDIVWVVEPNITNTDKYMINSLGIPILNSIHSIANQINPDIVLITSPYGTRDEIFQAIKGKTKGIYCEKPFAKSLQEHNALISNYKDYEFTIGYQRRSLESVILMKNIINNNLFGNVQKVYFEFGNIGVRTGGFQSDVKLSGGGLLFEAGVHWVDTVLYTLNAIDVKKLKSTVEYQCGLDVHVESEFKITIPNNELVDFQLKVTQIQETTNKIIYTFKDVNIELKLFDDTARPIIVPHNKPSKRYALNNYPRDIGASSSLGQGIEYWDKYLSGFKSQSASYTSAKESLLTTKVIEYIYE